MDQECHLRLLALECLPVHSSEVPCARPSSAGANAEIERTIAGDLYNDL